MSEINCFLNCDLLDKDMIYTILEINLIFYFDEAINIYDKNFGEIKY